MRSQKLLALIKAVKEYIDQLPYAKRELENDGAVYINLYDMWRSKLQNVFPRFDQLVELVRSLSRPDPTTRTTPLWQLGLQYTYYFIYDETKAHSLAVTRDFLKAYQRLTRAKG